MDIIGNKTAMKMTEAEMARQKRKVPEYEIKQTEEKREIAGYPCKKADIKSKDGDFSVWYTEDIAVRNSNWDSPFKGIHGFLMEFAMVQNGMNMKLAAKKVSEEKVDDSMFIIPEGYKMTTPEELQKMFGK
jgi:GLPGLI family protein